MQKIIKFAKNFEVFKGEQFENFNALPFPYYLSCTSVMIEESDLRLSSTWWFGMVENQQQNNCGVDSELYQHRPQIAWKGMSHFGSLLNRFNIYKFQLL